MSTIINKPRFIAVTLGAVVLAMAVVSPALGGPSLRSLVKKMVKKEVAMQVAKATGPQGPAGPLGANGQPGTPGAPGSALAYAFVKTNNAGAVDTVDESRSKNITDANVTHPANGIWCFNVPFDVNNALVSPTTNSTIPAVQGVDTDAVSCPGNEDLQVDHATLVDAQSNNEFMVLVN